MKFTHSTTEHRLLFRNTPEKMQPQQENKVEPLTEFYDRWEQTEKRVQEKLDTLGQLVTAFPEGTKERSQKGIAHHLFEQRYKGIADRLEHLEEQRRYLYKVASKQITKFGEASRLETSDR